MAEEAPETNILNKLGINYPKYTLKNYNQATLNILECFLLLTSVQTSPVWFFKTVVPNPNQNTKLKLKKDQQQWKMVIMISYFLQNTVQIYLRLIQNTGTIIVCVRIPPELSPI